MSADSTAVRFTHSDAAREWANSPERETLFTVERKTGEADEFGNPIVASIDYTMPARPNAGLALQYLRMARRDNPDVAMSWLIETAIGEEGYDALVDELAGEEDPVSVLRSITEKIQRVALGGLDGPKA